MRSKGRKLTSVVSERWASRQQLLATSEIRERPTMTATALAILLLMQQAILLLMQQMGSAQVPSLEEFWKLYPKCVLGRYGNACFALAQMDEAALRGRVVACHTLARSAALGLATHLHFGFRGCLGEAPAKPK